MKKNKEKKLLSTSQNVPIFGFKSAILFFIMAVISTFLPSIFGGFTKYYRELTVLVGALLIGISIPFGEYFLDNKKKVDRKFFYKFIAYAIISGFVLFLAYLGKRII